MTARLIVCGLGNPGEEYAETRHNLGFRVVDGLALRGRGRWSRPHERYALCHVRLGNREVLLVKPQTYMNLSGEALAALRALRPIPAAHMLAVSDDIALALGAVRLRTGGSDGGHNGLKSIVEHLGTTRFPRLRLGVGPVPVGVDPVDFVVGVFSADQADDVIRMIRHAVHCVTTIATDGLSTAMQRFNRNSGPSSTETG